MNIQDVDILEQWWVEKSRVNFYAYRQYLKYPRFKTAWFPADISTQLQQFYVDYTNGLRPILCIQAPPQHGKSDAVTDFVPWLVGKINNAKIIYASYSDTLGVRCNTAIQRAFDNPKHQAIFPDACISQSNVVTQSDKARRNSDHIEFLDGSGVATGGQFRNTTVNGRVNGEGLDIGIIDDAVKGRAEANSLPLSQKIWDWFTDDFGSRFSDLAGLIVVMTRWATHDIIARMVDAGMPNIQVINYEAIATGDESHRLTGEPLFPEHKSLEFLMNRKTLMHPPNFEAQYQGRPVPAGGNFIKDKWWGWWKVLPKITYKFITADTSQKAKDTNDYNDFKCWGYSELTDCIYLLDHLRGKFEAPELSKEAEVFYKKHDTPRLQVGEPILRCMYIEDKASGIGLLQEFKRKKMKVVEVPRSNDKIYRAEDAAPYIAAGKVHLNVDIKDVGNTTLEAREFPNSKFDDDIDTVLTAVEVTYINKKFKSGLRAAMEAD